MDLATELKEITEINQILTEEQLRERMSILAERFPDERESLKTAYVALGKAEAKVRLYITFLESNKVQNPTVREYLRKSKEDGVKLTVADKEALIEMEIETLKDNYEVAKFDCETTEKDYAKLQPLLNFYQTLRK